MKASLIQIRNQAKQWYDESNDKYREILEENELALDFNVSNETFTITVDKNTFEKIKNKEIIINMEDKNGRTYRKTA